MIVEVTPTLAVDVREVGMVTLDDLHDDQGFAVTVFLKNGQSREAKFLPADQESWRTREERDQSKKEASDAATAAYRKVLDAMTGKNES